MQVQKPEIREKILSNAEELFFREGFEGTSTRKIAKQAGISVSNLYKYFTDKQDIFRAVINPFYIESQADLENLFAMKHSDKDNMSENAFGIIMEMMLRDRYKFVILVNRSEGTEYSRVKEEMINMTAEHIGRSAKAEALKESYTLQVIASNFLEGILKIAERYHDDPQAINTNIGILVQYHMAGISQFLKE